METYKYTHDNMKLEDKIMRLRPNSKRLLQKRGYIYSEKPIDLRKAKMTKEYQEANK